MGHFYPALWRAQGFGFAGLGGQQFGAGHGGTAELFPQGIGGAVQLLLLVDAGGIGEKVHLLKVVLAGLFRR